ncbi:uncharacterized protein LOC143915306 [Arctopsyche grandis]|uniref:uncharacterized protein LOC143915306 n=1 Tax=Arctopsyche grandis TaxID=121162 RepID=UPI00406D9B2D
METIVDESVEKFKRMLVSRDYNLQIKAVSMIKQRLDHLRAHGTFYEATLEFFVTNDICLHLSEASATLNLQLLRSIIYCLKYFSQVPSFYKDSCAPYIVSALIRAAHLNIKEDSNENIVQIILNFIIEVFSRVKEYNLTPIISSESSYDCIQILTLLDSLLERKNSTLDTLLLGGKVLHLILSDALVSVNPIIEDYIASITNKSLKYLCNTLLENEVKLSYSKHVSCIIGMICRIGIDLIVFCQMLVKCPSKALTGNKSNEIASKFGTGLKYVEKNMECVYHVINLIVGKIKNYESFMDYSSFELFLNFINVFLNEPKYGSFILIFTKHLIHHGFLILLPRLRATSKNINLRRLCIINLVELLVILSNETFDLSKWEGGEAAFRIHIYEGFLNHNDNINMWPNKLYDAKAPDSALDSLIIFFYFYHLNCDSSKSKAQMLLPYIVCHILTLPTCTRCPPMITKCLWLIFAMANSPGADISRVNGGKLSIEKANYKLSNLIFVDMEDFYTHHISIIEWAYSTRIPFATQFSVLSMWIKQEGSIPSNLMSSTAVWWSLLEIIINGVKTVLPTTTELLKTCLENYCDDENALKIKEALWDSLPNILTMYIEDGESEDDETLMFMLDLCTTQVPPNPDKAIVQKTAFLLLSAVSMIDKNNEKLMFYIFEEVLRLLNVSLDQENTIVLSQFINSKVLIEILDDTRKYSNISLSILSCRTLSILTYYTYLYKLRCEFSITINPLFIVELLKIEINEDKCHAVIQLYYTCLKAMYHAKPNVKTLMNLPSNFKSGVVIDAFRSIFFRLQMVCCKESKMQSLGALQCLCLMLHHVAITKNGLIFKKISSQPWTNMMIKFYLSQNEPWRVHEKFLNFVKIWLQCIQTLQTECEGKINISKNSLHNKCCIVSKTLLLLINAFDNEETQLRLHKLKKPIVLSILNTISVL